MQSFSLKNVLKFKQLIATTPERFYEIPLNNKIDPEYYLGRYLNTSYID